jgi:ferredoxin
MKRRDFIKSALTVAALSPLAKLSAQESNKKKGERKAGLWVCTARKKAAECVKCGASERVCP